MELDERPTPGMRWDGPKLVALVIGVVLWVLIIAVLSATVFAAPTPARAPTQPAVQLQVDPKVQVSLRVLDRLRQMGYSWTTDAGALKAIKHWQRVNGLVVDGIVGSETAGSLGITTAATATVPATRLNPPPPPPQHDPSRPAEGNVEAIIREVWPDDLEEWALAIARRESNLQPEVINRSNGDATGLFQIMWSVHRRWLCPQLGVCAQSQLQDARTNATAALALYERAGGPGPWKL